MDHDEFHLAMVVDQRVADDGHSFFVFSGGRWFIFLEGEEFVNEMVNNNIHKYTSWKNVWFATLLPLFLGFSTCKFTAIIQLLAISSKKQ